MMFLLVNIQHPVLPTACDMKRDSSIVSKDFVIKNFLVTKLKKKSMAKGMVMADQQ